MEYNREIVAISIANRRIVWSNGFARGSGEASHDINFDHNNIRQVDYRNPKSVSAMDLEDTLERTFDEIKHKCSDLKAISISVCTPLVSAATSDRLIPGSGYGKIARNSLYTQWHAVNVYDSACKYFPHLKATIWVRPDTDFGAVGEHSKRFRDGILASPDDKHRYGNGFHERTTLGFLKLSADVNIGVTRGGIVGAGKFPPRVSILQPRRLRAIDRQTGRVFRDGFPGVCATHGDCYSGLISIRALLQRLFVAGLIAEDERDDESKLLTLPASHQIWDLVAGYAAQLCLSIVCHHAPSLIALSGRLVRDNMRDGLPDNGLVEKINSAFREMVSTTMPDFHDLNRPDGYIQLGYCKWPVLYGSLVFAARHLPFGDPSTSDKVTTMMRDFDEK